MNRLIQTWQRRLLMALAVWLIVTVVMMAITLYFADADSNTLGFDMNRYLFIPLLAALSVFFLTSAVAQNQKATSANHTEGSASATMTADAAAYRAQVVGISWMNPLNRRDYPTEWQLLWALGLVKPNQNDDMVRTDSKSFATLQSIGGIAASFDATDDRFEYYVRYIDTLLPLFGTKYVMNPKYFYTVAPKHKKDWHEMAGIHIELAMPEQVPAEKAAKYLSKGIISEFCIGLEDYKDLWTKDTPPNIRVHTGGTNAGFTSLNAALDYLQTNPGKTVWVMNWDAPDFPPDQAKINENLVMLVLADPEVKTEREPLAWIGRATTGNLDDFDKKVGTSRAVQAWKSTIAAAAHNMNIDPASIAYIVHDAGKGSDVSSERIGPLAQTLTEILPDFDFQKQTFNTTGLLGNMGAGSALTNVALAIGRANHFGGNTLIAGTNDQNHPVAVVITPPSTLTKIDPSQDWFRARGGDDAYLPWWGRRHDVNYGQQGYSY